MRTRRSQSSSNPVPSPEHKAGHRDASISARQTAVAAETSHRSVLLHESLDGLAIQADDIVVDGTLGGAGHSHAIAGQLGKKGALIGFDLDQDAIARAAAVLAQAEPTIVLIKSNFRHLERELQSRGVHSVDKILLDLGWSSFQLSVERGFSFLRDEPLLMTYAKEGDEPSLTAAMIVNEWEESSLADIIFGWGEERYSRRIAKAIVEHREEKPFATTGELVDVIRAAVPATYRYGRLHPATKTFQALRIAVNDEMGALTEGLQSAWHLLASGGRIAVITFHSIEDRIVKQAFLRFAGDGGERITHKPITPSDDELAENPRARSAKLRIISKPIDFHN